MNKKTTAQAAPAPAVDAKHRKKEQLTVAEYLTRAIDMSQKTQAEICDALGYPNRNVITLFKQGKTKLPINKVRAMAIVLGLDPANLLRMVMNEYMPDAWRVIEEVVGDRLVTRSQQEFERLALEETGNADLDFSDPKFNAAMRQVLKDYSKRTDKV
jgi:transcriptional regulator with XRE-family HTH domain